jgi:hypothetical protein
MGDFPSQVQAIQSPAVAGDFCDANRENKHFKAF